MKTFLILFVLALQINLLSAQSSERKLNGIIQKNRWSKSAESYCAQGSDYYVVIYEKSKRVVLELNTEELLQKTEELKDKKVSISGKFETKIIKTDTDPYSQHPVGEEVSNEFKCTVFIVSKIELAQSKGISPKKK